MYAIDDYLFQACLHHQASSEILNMAMQSTGLQATRMIPKCDNNGAYRRIQQFQGFSWCVDDDGKEISGK